MSNNGASVRLAANVNNDGSRVPALEKSDNSLTTADAPPLKKLKSFGDEVERIDEKKESRDYSKDLLVSAFLETPTAKAKFVYHRKGDEFYFNHGDGWGPVSDTRARQILAVDHRIEDSRDSSAAMLLLRGIMKDCTVHDVAQVAGYKAGVHRDTMKRPFLIPNSTPMIEPVDRPWMLIRNLVDAMLGEEQARYFHSWMHWGLLALRDQSQTPGHYLVIMGPPGCGKTLVQEKIISPIFGCGPTDCLRYITGQTDFNGDLLRNFHLMISDGLAFKSYQERKEYTERVKHLIANSSQRLEAKYQNAMNVQFCCRLSNTLNLSAIESLPVLEEGMTDKLLLFKAESHAHLPNKNFKRQDYESQIAEELPGYVYWLLNSFSIPSELEEDGAERLGFKAYQNPGVLDSIREDSREIQLAEILRKHYPIGVAHEDTNGNHYQAMSAFGSSVSKRLINLCRNEPSFTHLLSKLVGATTAGKSILNVDVSRRRSTGGQRLSAIVVRPLDGEPEQSIPVGAVAKNVMRKLGTR